MMKTYTFCRLLAVVLLLFLLTSAVSCRGGGEEIPQTTTSATVSETSASENAETTVAATTEAPVTESPEAEICADWNRLIVPLFDGETAGKTADAEKMMELMLPYLIGSGEIEPRVDSYHLHGVSVTGDAISMPREIYWADGIKMTEYEDAEYGVYREIEVCHENGTAYFSTFDGMTTADGVSLNDNSSPMGDLVGETLTVIEEQLTQQTENTYSVSNRYIRGILNALFGADTVTGWSNRDMACVLDVGKYRESGELTMTVAVAAPVAIQLEIRLGGIDQSRETMNFSLRIGEDVEIKLVGERQDGSMSGAHMRLRAGESITEATQTVNGDRTVLTMSTKSGDLLTLSYKMVLDMISETEGRGTVDVTFRVGEDQSSDFILLSANDSSVESVAKGEFSVRVKDGELQRLEMGTSATAATVTSDIRMMLNQAGAVVGESVMEYAVNVRDSADPAQDSSYEMTVKLGAVSGDVADYTVKILTADAAGSSTATASVTVADGSRPQYSTDEQRLISRAKAFLYDPEKYQLEAQRMVNTMMRTVTLDTVASYPETFYITDSDGDGIVILIELVNDGGYYIYADILLDVENYTYFYDGYDTSFQRRVLAGIRHVADKMHIALTELSGYEARERGKAIAYTYDETQEVYVLWDLYNERHGYTWEEPRAEDYPGYALHALQLGQNKTPIREIHDFQATYSGICYETLTCRDCHMTLVSYEPMHHLVTTEVICEAQGERPHTALAHCDRCQQAKRLILTDERGGQMEIFLSQATPSLLQTVQEYRVCPEELHPDISQTRDPKTHYVITGIHMVGSSFAADVIIPDLREITGDTIIGLGVIPQANTAILPGGTEMNLVLPEGLEFIMSKQLVSVFRLTRSLQLPSTLIHMDSVFNKSSIEELVIPASVKYVGNTLEFPNLTKLTVEAHLEVLPEIFTPKLKELHLLGKYRVIEGFRVKTQIEELILPEGVEEIGMSAFDYLTSLKRLSLPESLTKIPDHAFRGCSALQTLYLADTVTHIGTSAFAECSALTEVRLPSGLEKLSWGCFESATSLKQVTLPASVRYISEAAFRNCTSLETVEVQGTLEYVGYDSFYNCPMLRDVPVSDLT